MYDPFIADITVWCNAGVTVKEMAERLGEGYTIQGIYQFIKTKGLRSSKRVTYEARNKCNNCEYCREYINTNNTKGRICTKSWRSIQPLVIYRPEWCEKAKGYEDNKGTDTGRGSGTIERDPERTASV